MSPEEWARSHCHTLQPKIVHNDKVFIFDTDKEANDFAKSRMSPFFDSPMGQTYLSPVQEYLEL